MRLSMIAVAAVACLCVFVQVGRAQDTPKQRTMTGCLLDGRTPDIYVLGVREWGGPRAATIVSSSTDLSPYVKKEVEITGKLVPPKEAERDPSVPKAFHYMHATAIKMVSATCR